MQLPRISLRSQHAQQRRVEYQGVQKTERDGDEHEDAELAEQQDVGGQHEGTSAHCGEGAAEHGDAHLTSGGVSRG